MLQSRSAGPVLYGAAQGPVVPQLAPPVSRPNRVEAARSASPTEKMAEASPALPASVQAEGDIKWSSPDGLQQQMEPSGTFVHLENETQYGVSEEQMVKDRILDLIGWMKDHPDQRPLNAPPELINAVQSRLLGPVTVTVDGVTISLAPRRRDRDAGE